MSFSARVEVSSPLGGPARLVESRPTAPIIEKYKSAFGYDASGDFAGIDELHIFECEATGYRFFYPFVEGKECLYRTLEKFDWCYEEGKWEHESVAASIPENASVLDVGCGRGAFLSLVKSPNRTGIELNRSAAQFARSRGITVIEAMIGDHASDCPEAYDVVTAFQVLEHIADPLPFLADCIKALKPGGILIIAVPNNDAFIRFANLPLNQPPHHVGLWTPKSLSALSTVLPLEVVRIEEEPLRELDWYRSVIEERYLPKRWQRSLYHRLGGHKIVDRFVRENAQSISGHSVVGHFSKL